MSRTLDAEMQRIMNMSEAEIDADLRAQGLDPDVVAEKGRKACARALVNVQAFKAADAELCLERRDANSYLVRLSIGHQTFGICQPRDGLEANSLLRTFRNALCDLLLAAKESGQQEAYAEGRKDEAEAKEQA